MYGDYSNVNSSFHLAHLCVEQIHPMPKQYYEHRNPGDVGKHHVADPVEVEEEVWETDGDHSRRESRGGRLIIDMPCEPCNSHKGDVKQRVDAGEIDVTVPQMSRFSEQQIIGKAQQRSNRVYRQVLK